MQDHVQEFDLTEMCAALALSRSGYYRWATADTSVREQSDRQIKVQIQTIHQQANGRYG